MGEIVTHIEMITKHVMGLQTKKVNVVAFNNKGYMNEGVYLS